MSERGAISPEWDEIVGERGAELSGAVYCDFERWSGGSEHPRERGAEILTAQFRSHALVATQNIDTLGPIWTFSLRGVLTFVASGLDINGCVLSYFEGTANLHCYTSCTLTTLHCSKVSFLPCCHMKRYNKMFTKMWGVYSLLWDTVYIYIYIYIYIYNLYYIILYMI